MVILCREIPNQINQKKKNWQLGHVLIENERFYVKDGMLQKVCRKAPKPRWFFLFNDVLVYATPSLTSGFFFFLFFFKIPTI